MKKSLITLVFLQLLCFSLRAQFDTIYVNGVPKVQKKKIPGVPDPSPIKPNEYVVEFSYGYPFIPLREAVFFGTGVSNNFSNQKIKLNTNHLCLRTDYQLTEVYSVGLEFTYATMQLEYTRPYNISIVSNGSVITYKGDSTFTAKVTKIRLLAKFGYHFNISEKFDAYGTAGFGFKGFTYDSRDYTLYSSNVVNDILPIAVRGSLGGRFFFDKNIALHVEAGLGGPIMQMGLTFKMR